MRREKALPSTPPPDSFCQGRVQQHLIAEQEEDSPQVTVPESQAGRRRVVRSSLFGQRPRGARGAASPRRALFEGGIEGPANNEPAHLTGACPDLVELGVPQETPHGIVIDVTVPTCHQRETEGHLFSLSGGTGESTAPGSLRHPRDEPGQDSPRHWIPSRATWVAHSAEYRITPAQS